MQTMSLGKEEYVEYNASCDKCGKDVLEVIEYMDIEEWDSECGVCPKCKKLFCHECVIEDKGKFCCPECKGEVLEFWDCSVYDLIAILEHDCQPFEKKEIDHSKCMEKCQK